MNEQFLDWFCELEGYHLRAERFYDDLGAFSKDDPQVIVRWLQAAYIMGREHERALLIKETRS
jgi:hypothetical protein